MTEDIKLANVFFKDINQCVAYFMALSFISSDLYI